MIDFDNVQEKKEVSKEPVATTPTVPQSSLPIIPDPNNVILRKLHTIIEIKIYPNGQTYQSSKTWFEDKIYYVKKKVKKTKAVKKAVKKEVESY